MSERTTRDQFDPGEGGTGTVYSDDGVITRWTPSTTDPDVGGPDSTNPLLKEDGALAIDPEWPEERSFGPAGIPSAIASPASGQHTRALHDRGRVRRVTLNWEKASGTDVELVRRALQLTRGVAGRTRFRHPMLDAPGPVNTAPWVRFVPQTLSVRRSADGASAVMRIELEYLE